MSEETIKCPNCGKEINVNQKFCTNCGAELCQKEQAPEVSKETLQTNNKIKDIVKSKPFVISLSLFVVLIVAAISSFAYITYNNNLASLIVPVEQSQIKQMNSTEMLNTLIQQDDDLYKIISKLPKNKVNKVFEIFYKNLLSLISNMNVDDLNITDDYVLTPKTDIIGFEINDWSGVWLNDEYIFNRYSKYLNKSWQEFLELSKNSKKRDIGFAAYIEKKDIIKEITLWQKFMSKNPNFALNEDIKKSIKFLTSNIIYNDYTFYDYNKESISNEQKQGYEEFLKTIDKNTQEYNIVQNCYNELQKNNFKPNSKFYKLLSDYNNNDKWYEDMYKNALESEKLSKEEENQDKYDNSIFTRDEMKHGYEFAQKVKKIVNNKDINAFADLISYPIDINTLNNEQKINIQNKEQFIRLGADRIFTNKFIQEVCKDEDLFVSYRGFMMGNGPNLFYTYMDGSLKIYALNISE